MGFIYYRWVIDHADVSGPDFNTLLILADFANDDGHCWPSVPRIAARARISERSVKRSISDLAERGFLERRGRAKGFRCWLHLPDKCSDGACLACRIAREGATQAPSEEATQAPSCPEEATQALSVAAPSEEKGPLSPRERATQSRERATQALPPTPPYKEEPTEPTREPTTTPTATRSGRRSAKRPKHEQPTLIPMDDPVEGVVVNGSGPEVREIVAEWIDGCKRRPPDSVIGQIGKQLRKLADEDFTADQLRASLQTWQERDVHPSVLPSIAHGVVNGSPNGRKQRSTVDDRVNGFLDIANNYLQGEATHAEVGNGSPTRHDQRL